MTIINQKNKIREKIKLLYNSFIYSCMDTSVFYMSQMKVNFYQKKRLDILVV